MRISADPLPQAAPIAPEVGSPQRERDQGEAPAPQSPITSSEDWLKEDFSAVRNREMARLNHYIPQEEALMFQTVRLMEPYEAAYWLSTFVSRKPFDCPIKQQEVWIQAIISAVERNNLPLCKEILALAASIISIESSFRADPLAADPSRGETVAAMVERAEKELLQKYSVFMSVPPVPSLYRMYKERYYQRLIECKTEGDIEVLARTIAEDLKRDAAILPGFVRNIVLKEIDKVSNVVRTKGSMQLNFPRARQVMKERGEEFTDQELCDYMYTVEGGVDVGLAALKPIFVQYAAYYAQEGTLSWLFYVGMDYHYGPFTSRNMMEQIRIRDLSGANIPVDGDLLAYDDKGDPRRQESQTLTAAASALPHVPKSSIFKAFLLEKDPHYVYTEVHKQIEEMHRERYGPTSFAVVGDLWMGENAKIKHGATWKTQAYLNKLDKYLNSIPWGE
ncbi:MAG: DUF1615 family protein [Desulfomonilaceae bacterium]